MSRSRCPNRLHHICAKGANLKINKNRLLTAAFVLWTAAGYAPSVISAGLLFGLHPTFPSTFRKLYLPRIFHAGFSWHVPLAPFPFSQRQSFLLIYRTDPFCGLRKPEKPRKPTFAPPYSLLSVPESCSITIVHNRNTGSFP